MSSNLNHAEAAAVHLLTEQTARMDRLMDRVNIGSLEAVGLILDALVHVGGAITQDEIRAVIRHYNALKDTKPETT